MVDNRNLFEDVTEAADMIDAGKADTHEKSSGGLWVTSPCRNSVELSLTEMKYLEPCLQTEPEFFDEAGNLESTGLPPQRVPDDPQLAALRHSIADYWMTHIARARSLGAGARYQDYVLGRGCKGLTCATG